MTGTLRDTLRRLRPWLILAMAVWPAAWHALDFPDDIDQEFPAVERPNFSRRPPPAYRLAAGTRAARLGAARGRPGPGVVPAGRDPRGRAGWLLAALGPGLVPDRVRPGLGPPVSAAGLSPVAGSGGAVVRGSGRMVRPGR